MTRISIATAFTAGALLAGAGAARADGVVVHVAGRSPSAVRGDVVRAADRVCASAVAHDPFGEYFSVDDCVSTTVSATLRELARGTNTGSFR